MLFLGIGMPYNRNTTDRYNLCNISSAEIPKLKQSLVDWLASLDDAALAAHGIERSDIDDGEAYSRLALGEYFRSQYTAIADDLRLEGIPVIEHACCEVDDVIDSPDIRTGDSSNCDRRKVRIRLSDYRHWSCFRRKRPAESRLLFVPMADA